MIITIPLAQEPLQTILRRAGYAPEGIDPRSGEFSYVRRFVSAPYPRFHLFVKSVINKEAVLNIHLDQKKPSYAGSPAHGGEYDGPVVSEEAARICRAVTAN
ncbi:MAG: hypothetical protein Q8P70_01905 [bacterium]|nr:hypothetical protein [bacterium]